MERRWIETLQNAPLPEPGRLTERARAAAAARPTRRALSVAAVTFAAALPAVAFYCQRTPPVVTKAPTTNHGKQVALTALDDRRPRHLELALRRATESRLSEGEAPMTVRESKEFPMRYPLSPLPGAPQPEGVTAKIAVHADSFQLVGTVTLAPDAQTREVLIAVFDDKRALIDTTQERVPGTQEEVRFTEVRIRPFLVARKARYFQLCLRVPRRYDDSAEQIVGGYVAMPRPGGDDPTRVPAPEGVSVTVDERYQSNVTRDHFVRCQVTLSKPLLSRLGELSLRLHGAIFDETGKLVSVASEPIVIQPGRQRLDLNFGPLIDSARLRFQFVVTQGR